MKRWIAMVLSVSMLLTLWVPLAGADEITDGWNYDQMQNILLLKDYQGPVKQEFTGNLIAVVEGTVLLSDTLKCENLLLVVLPGSSLTIAADSGGCVKSAEALLLTGKEGALTMSSTDETVPAIESTTMFTAGAGSVTVESAAPVAVKAETAILQQDGVVEIQAQEQALEGALVQPASHQIFVDGDLQTPTEGKTSGASLQSKEYVAPVQTGDEVSMMAPQASAISAHALMACYDDHGKLLAVTPGTRTDETWNFDHQNLDGTWKVFFLDEDYSPECKSYELPTMTKEPEQLEVLEAEEAEAADKTEVDYAAFDQAIAFLQKMDLMKGYEDGTFKEENTINRAEIAVVVARLSNAGTDVSQEYASACKLEDVPEGHWAAPYIGYCKSTGMLDHMIRGKQYQPLAEVTDLELAAMLLTLLGYSGKNMGYCSRNWAKNVYSDALEMGLLNKLEHVTAVPVSITRGEAAQMIWNALQAKVVVGTLNLNKIMQELPRDTETFLKGFQATAGVLFSENFSIRRDQDCNLVLISNKDILLQVLYNVTLKTASRDEWGRSGTVWRLVDSSDRTRYQVNRLEQPMQSYHTEVDLKTALRTQLADGGYIVQLFRNGIREWEGDLLTAELLEELQTYTGNGVQMELYLNETEKIVTAVVIDLYMAQIAAVDNEIKTCVLQMVDGTFIAELPAAENWKVGQWLQFHCRADEIVPVCVTEPVSGRVETVYDESVVLDGNTYQYSKHYGVYTDPAEEKLLPADLGSQVELVIDLFGYVHYAIRPVPSVVLILADSLYKTTEIQDNNTVKSQCFGDQISFEQAPVPAEVQLTETMYQILVESGKDAVVSVSDAEPLELVEIANVGTASRSGVQVMMDDTLFYLTGKTQILTRTKNAQLGLYEYNYYDGSAALDWTATANCPCQYLASGNKLTYIFFDLAAVPEEKPQSAESLVFVKNAVQDPSIRVDDPSACIYRGICCGEEAYLVFPEQLETSDETERVMSAYLAAFTQSGISDMDAMPIFTAEGPIAKVESSPVQLIGGEPMLIKTGEHVLELLADDASIALIEEEMGSANCIFLNDGSQLAGILEQYSDISAYIACDDVGDIITLYLHATE